MIEREFDRRLADWLQDGPSAASNWVLEAVVEHARRRPRRRSLGARWLDLGRPGAASRAGSPTVRIGIVLALLALAFAIAGIVYVGAPNVPVGPTPTAAPTARPASVFTCPVTTNPNAPGPADQERPLFAYAGPVTFDRQSGRLVAVVGTTGALWTFDVCANAWHRSSVTLPGAPSAIAYDEAAGLTVLFGSRLRTYDVEADALRVKGAAPVSEDLHAVYRSATAQLLVRDDTASRLWDYDVATDTWQEITQLGDIPPGVGTGASLLAYDASVDRLVLYVAKGERRETYEFDFGTSTWVRQPTPAPDLMLVWGDLGRYEVAYDAAAERTVIFSRGRVIAYDATAHEWEVVFDSFMEADPPISPGDPTHRQATALAYDAVNERILVVGGSRRTTTAWFDVDDVIAFDLRTRTWIELLAQSVP